MAWSLVLLLVRERASLGTPGDYCRDAEGKGFQDRWAQKAQNCLAHFTSSFWSHNLFLQPSGPVFKLQGKIGGINTQQMTRFPWSSWEIPTYSSPSTSRAIASARHRFKSCLTPKPTSSHYSTQLLCEAVTLSLTYLKALQYWWWDGHVCL